MGWWLGGMAYASALFWSRCGVAPLKRFDGMIAIFFLFAVVWAADVFAYFAGRTFGGPKLAPRISPKKTWSGMIGGLIGSMSAGLGLLMLVGISVSIMHALIALIAWPRFSGGRSVRIGLQAPVRCEGFGHAYPWSWWFHGSAGWICHCCGFGCGRLACHVAGFLMPRQDC